MNYQKLQVKGVIRYSIFTAIVLFVLVITAGCSGGNETLHATDLENRTFDLKSSLNVQFSGINSDEIIKSNFQLISKKGEIKITYISGEYENVEVFLYKSTDDEYIMLNNLNAVNDSILFNHLLPNTTYSVGFICKGISHSNSVVLGFT